MKIVKTDKWTYNEQEFGIWENLICDSKEEAIECCIADYGTGFVGQICKVYFVEKDINAAQYTGLIEEYLREDLSITLCNEVGEIANEWQLGYDDHQDLEKEIAKAIIRYINKKEFQPKDYFTLKNIEEVKKG